jgi:glutamate-ammonia-ligase adenylyltransferase
MATGQAKQLEERLGTGPASDRLAATLARGPEPEAALRRTVELLDALLEADAARVRALATRPEALARALPVVCGTAPFLARFFARHPTRLLALIEPDLSQARTPEALAEALEDELRDVPPADVAEALRRFKYTELARITVRDCADDLVPVDAGGEILAELSRLADVLLARALAHAAGELARRLGPPRWVGADGAPVELGFCVLALGKLGGGELNYSSDVDLVYVCESPPAAATPLGEGPGALSPAEYFTRLARDFGLLLSEPTLEGFLYRVDVDLRPEGGQGLLVPSSDALESYYDGWAATWERAAFTKARPVAGDEDFGWRVVRRVHPTIYRASMDLAAVEGIKDMKRRVEAERVGGGEGFDVKLGAGGIRDVEFVAQALQLLHGGRIPQLRGRSTQAALRSIAEARVLPAGEAEELLRAYRFLRRVENRLQMREERQVHVLPAATTGRERLARALGYAGPDAAARFEGDLDGHRRRVRAAFEALFQAEEGERVLDLFARNAALLFRLPSTRNLLEELARHFARAIEGSADPELALINLDRFTQEIGSRSSYYGLLLDRPELVPRLAALFGTSKFLSLLFATQPDLIEPVFADPDVLLLDREQLRRDLEAVRAGMQSSRDEVDAGLAALRCFQHRQLVNVGLLDLAGKIELAEAQAALTEIAEVCLEEGLALARIQLRRMRGGAGGEEPGEFLIVGMGKLGSRELNYGSDLDVIFLYGEGPSGAGGGGQEYFIRLAQKLVWALGLRTAEGSCYEIDARLRPSGNQGMLVTSLEGFRAYHERSAQVWERQALLRARPVAGSSALGDAFRALRREILLRPLPENAGAEIHRVRLRMERELAREVAGRRDLKTGRGGVLDVESVVQVLQLRHARAHPELLEVDTTARLLARVEALGLLDPEQGRVLREGWAFLQRLASRLRIVENRSISELDEQRAELEAVTRSLGYPDSIRGGGRRALLDDYRRHTEGIRRVYLEVLGVGEG